MRIALVDPFPNRPESAEREFLQRFLIAGEGAGVDCVTVVTSDDIEEARPDLVLTTHEHSRKLTRFPTIALVWSPLSTINSDPYSFQSLLSCDGFLAANEDLQSFLKDFQSGLGSRKPVGREFFLPTTYKSSELVSESAAPSLCYMGLHLDGRRHNRIFNLLAAEERVSFYGPEESWRQYPHCYRGGLPFDGRSVQRAIASHGISLCLHRAEHRKENTPSMRLFEALSVGANIVCDEIPLAMRHLRDIAYFVDLEGSPRRAANQILEIIDHISSHPAEARERAARGRSWFEANWSLESKITTAILPLFEQVGEVGKFRMRPNPPPPPRELSSRFLRLKEAAPPAPVVEVIIRAGGRPLTFLDRAVKSVLDATSAELPLGVVVVDYRSRKDLADYVRSVSSPDLPLRYVSSAMTGFRSTALWDGIRAVHAPFVCHLDDDDTVFPNHYRQLHAALQEDERWNVAYSGVVKVEDESGHYFKAPNFTGPLDQEIPERRELKFLDRFDLSRLARFDNYIQSNAWMARTSFIRSVIGADPELVVGEDVYLYLTLAAKGPFAFTGSPTAVWRWRSTSGDNSMMSVDEVGWIAASRRAQLRLRHVPFVSSLTFDQIFNAVSHDGRTPHQTARRHPPLAFGRKLVGGHELAASLVLQSFHTPEPDGIWTSAQVASFKISPPQDLRFMCGYMEVEFMPALGETGKNRIEFEVEGEAPVSLTVEKWSTYRLVLPIPAGSIGELSVTLRTSDVIRGDPFGDEVRDLGCFLRSLELREEPELGL